METLNIIKISLVALALLLAIGGGVWFFKSRASAKKKTHKEGHGGHGGGHGADPADLFFKLFIGTFLVIFAYGFWLEWSS